MKTQHAVLTLLIMVALLAAFVPAAQAKGASDRIIITSPALDEEVIVTDRAITDWLSMASLENIEAGSIAEPTGLGEGYTLDRQFETAPDQYQSFDSAVYYPDPGGDLGYVYFKGITNGSSEYDGKWYRARPGGDAAMKMVLADALPQTYLLLMSHSGGIHVLDPNTLDEITTVNAADREGYWTYAQASGTGTALYYQQGPGPLQTQYRLDLAARTNCRLASEAGIGTETLDGRIYQYTAGSGHISVYNPRATPPESTIPLPAEDMTLSVSPSQSMIVGFAPHDAGLQLVSVELLTGDHFTETTLYRTKGFRQPVELLMTAWDASGSVPRFYITDGVNLLSFPFAYRDGIASAVLDYDDRAAVEAGITATDLLGVYDSKLYLYHPMGRNVLTNTEAVERGDIHRGIFVIDAENGKQITHLQPDLDIVAGTLSQDYIYAIHAPEGETNAELVQIDLHTGDVVQTKTLTPDNWDTALVRLNADALGSLGAAGSLLACPDAEPASDVAEALPPTTTP